MATSPLNGPPPQPVPVGQPGTASSPPPGDPTASAGDQSLQLVTQHLMEAEQALNAAVEIMPKLAPIRDKFLNETKPQAGQLLFGQGSQPMQQPPQPSLQGLVAGAGMGMGQ